jgi:signal transduction histidine kinase
VQVINDILEFSKIESGKLELEKHPFELHRCIEEAFDLGNEEVGFHLLTSVAAVPRAKLKHVEVVYSIGDNVPVNIIGESASAFGV